MRGYAFPDGLVGDQIPRVSLYVPVQYLYQLVRPEVVVYQVKGGLRFNTPHEVEYVRMRTRSVYPFRHMIGQ